MKIKDRAKPKVPPVEPGVYIAVCIGVVDLGEQYSEKFKNYANKVKFIWELVGETVEVVVTTVLQTSAGRMIFTRLKDAEPKAG